MEDLGFINLCISTDEVTDPDSETFQLSRFKSYTLLLLKPRFCIIVVPIFSYFGESCTEVFAVGYALGVYVHTPSPIVGSVIMHQIIAFLKFSLTRIFKKKKKSHGVTFPITS